MSTIFIKTVKKEGKKRRLILYPEKRYTIIGSRSRVQSPPCPPWRIFHVWKHIAR
jgi:hypothetical protein